MDDLTQKQVESIATFDDDLVTDHVDDEQDGSELQAPHNVQRLQHDQSILALAVNGQHVYAGTQGGEVLVYSLRTYERVAQLQRHNGSILALSISRDKRLLFSSAADRYVNVWELDGLKHLASIYSTYDIGDIFCIAYSTILETIYLGCQNTSIQWCNLKDYASRPPPDPESHPSQRHDRFFDSFGPGGIRTPRRGTPDPHGKSQLNLEIDRHHVHQFAHFGYVYCMVLATGLQAFQREEVLISGGGDGVIRFWGLDAEVEGAIYSLGSLDDGRDAGESVLSIALDGSFLYSGRVEGEINVWDLETRQLLRSMKPHGHDILSLSFGGGFVFAAALDGSVARFNHRYEWLGGWKAHQGMALASGFVHSNSRPLYVSGGNDSSIALWEVSGASNRPNRSDDTADEHLLESLRQFVSFRTVSSDIKCKADSRRAASWLRSVFKRYGAVTELLTTEQGCNPVVFAEFRGTPKSRNNKTRILFYGHYDVVAAKSTKEKGWSADPFSMHGKDGYVYGRGVTDNKGPVMAAIYAVAELVAQNALECDVVFLIEGEEERGSRGFKQAIVQNKSLIGSVDYILLANSYWLDDEVPCLTYGLRGVIHATVEVNSDEPDLHSGVDGSKLLDEPVKDLMTLLARLSGPHGRIQIPQFYDDVKSISPQEKLLYEEIARALIERNPNLGGADNLIQSLLARWADATLTIHNFKTSGPQNSTIIPRHAQASLSLRLVPNQSVSQIASDLSSYLKNEFAKLESKNHLTVTIGNQAEPWLGDYNNKLFQTLEQAIMEVWSPKNINRRISLSSQPSSSSRTVNGRRPSTGAKGAPATSSTLAQGSSTPIMAPQDKTPLSPPISESPMTLTPSTTFPRARRPLYIREGGSIPAIRFLEKEFSAPAAHLPCGQASDNAHLDNERIRVLNLYNSKEIFKRVFLELPKE